MFNPIRANDPASQVIRQNAWVGLMVKVAYVFTGARCLRGYSAFILEKLGGWAADEANLGSLFVGKHRESVFQCHIVGILRVPVTLVPVFLVDRLGRRPLILASVATSVVAITLMQVCILLGPAWKVGGIGKKKEIKRLVGNTDGADCSALDQCLWNWLDLPLLLCRSRPAICSPPVRLHSHAVRGCV